MEEKTGFIDGQVETSPESSQAKESHDTTDSKQGVVVETPKWKAQLPDDLKDNENLNQYENIGALAKAVLEAQEGSNGEFAAPGEDDAEAWGELFNKLGRPENSENYELDSKLSDDVETNLRTVAHDMGLSQKQFSQLAEIMGPSNEAVQLFDKATFKGTAEECEKSLKLEFGEKYDQKMNLMKRGGKAVLNEDLDKVFRQFGQYNNPKIVKALITLGESIAEDVPPGGSNPVKEADDGWDYPD